MRICMYIYTPCYSTFLQRTESMHLCWDHFSCKKPMSEGYSSVQRQYQRLVCWLITIAVFMCACMQLLYADNTKAQYYLGNYKPWTMSLDSFGKETKQNRLQHHQQYTWISPRWVQISHVCVCTCLWYHKHACMHRFHRTNHSKKYVWRAPEW